MKCVKRWGAVVVLTASALAWPAAGAEMAPMDPKDPRAADRLALRDLLVKVEKALNRVDVETVVGVLDKDAEVVWQDAVRTLSHDQVRRHYDNVFKSGGAILKSVSIKAALGGPARFFGDDTAVAYGSTKETYELVGGTKVSLDGLWTTHVAKRDGQWKVTALHFSTNPFNNDVTAGLQRLAWMFGAGGVAVGLVVGWLLGRRRKA